MAKTGTKTSRLGPLNDFTQNFRLHLCEEPFNLVSEALTITILNNSGCIFCLSMGRDKVFYRSQKRENTLNINISGLSKTQTLFHVQILIEDYLALFYTHITTSESMLQRT